MATKETSFDISRSVCRRAEKGKSRVSCWPSLIGFSEGGLMRSQLNEMALERGFARMNAD